MKDREPCLPPILHATRELVSSESNSPSELSGQIPSAVPELATIVLEAESVPFLPGDETVAREIDQRLSAYLIDAGVRLERTVFEHPSGNGRYVPQGVVDSTAIIRESLWLEPGVYRTKTLLHEAAHYLAGHEFPRSRKECDIIATRAAAMVLEHFGIDITEFTNGSLLYLGATQDYLERTEDEMQCVSQQLIQIIEQGNTEPED